MDNNMQAALTKFVAQAQDMQDRYMSQNFPTLGRNVITVEPGRRYAKLIVSRGTGGQRVYCFVDMTNGDILKAASWKAPAKHARGNILSDDPLSAVTPYGANYLV